VVRTRVIVGMSLAIVIAALILLDGYLSTRISAHPAEWGLQPDRWLSNGLIITAMTLLLTLLTMRELIGFARGIGYRPFAPLAYIFGAGLVIGPYVANNAPAGLGLASEGWGMVWLALAVGAAFWMQATYRKTYHTMENIATTLMILFYGGGLAGFMVKLRMEIGGFQGVLLVMFFILIVKMTDTGAFFAGINWGRNKMIPWLSPKKTWEGFWGGVVTALIVSVGVGSILLRVGWLPESADALGYPWGLLVFGLLMALFSVAGDLCASLLKRDAAVTDSGDSLPGLGGVLDVLDSPLLAAPVAWFFWARLMPKLASAAGVT
jgi:phosphatidate cytidylyltransferase